jgi:aldose 1-epimerase
MLVNSTVEIGAAENWTRSATLSNTKVSEFGYLEDGRVAMLYEVVNATGSGFKVTDLGATIVAVNVPDRKGELADVVLGFDDPNSYYTGPYFGPVVGRYANRINRGKFSLNGKTYSLATNNGPNHLHGGVVGFDEIFWTGEIITVKEGQGVRFNMTSPDGDEGYPGQLDVTVSYVFTAANELIVDYVAKAAGDTIVNLSQHSMFNLGGHDSGSTLGHELMINAAYYTPVDKTLIPTGEIRIVAGTAFDFTKAKSIGRDINKENVQLSYGGGFDHNWVLRSTEFSDELHTAAVLTDPASGRSMEIVTDQPGLQFYAGNNLKGDIIGKGGARYPRHGGLALETQHFPDSPNQPHFPRTTLKAGETFKSRTVFRFSVVEEYQ